MANIPPLPKIDGDMDLALDVFMHRDLKGTQVKNDQYGDSDRLAELGGKAVELAVTYHLFTRRPHLDVQDIEIQRKKYIGMDAYENIKGWLDSYGLRQKYRVPPSQMHLLDDPEEITRYFYTYVGAIYWRQGLAPVQAWISGLIDPDEVVTLPGQDQGNQAPQAFASQQSSTGYPQNHPVDGHSYAPPPVGFPPPLPTPPPNMAPYPAGGMSLVTLALVNQTAAQKHLVVSYPAQQEGPPHQPTWTVRCCINGVEKGIGRGKSQKAAKEDAARQAWVNMGWGS